MRDYWVTARDYNGILIETRLAHTEVEALDLAESMLSSFSYYVTVETEEESPCSS